MNKMDDHSNSDVSFFEVVNNSDFRTLLRLSHKKALTWDSFLTYPLPQGISPLDCWEAIMGLGRCLGVDVLEDADDHLLWYRRTHELESMIDRLAVESSPNGSLIRSVQDYLGLAYTDSLRHREAAATLGRAGLVDDTRAFAQSMEGVSDPQGTLEKIARNYFIIDCDMEHYRTSNIDHALVEELYARLTEGVDSPLVVWPEQQEVLSYEKRKAYLTKLLEYASSALDDEDSVVLRGMFLGYEMMRYRVFGTLTSSVASLVTRLFYLQNDLPVLALAPYAEMKLAWQRGQGVAPVEHISARDIEATFRRSPGNITLPQTVSAACMMKAVEDIASDVERITRSDNAARSALLADTRFNHRQRSILARALRIPNAEFSARYHESKNSISYATARRDLVELEEAGYLVREPRGKGAVFVAGPQLRAIEDEGYAR